MRAGRSANAAAVPRSATLLSCTTTCLRHPSGWAGLAGNTLPSQPIHQASCLQRAYRGRTETSRNAVCKRLQSCTPGSYVHGSLRDLALRRLLVLPVNLEIVAQRLPLKQGMLCWRACIARAACCSKTSAGGLFSHFARCALSCAVSASASGQNYRICAKSFQVVWNSAPDGVKEQRAPEMQIMLEVSLSATGELHLTTVS